MFCSVALSKSLGTELAWVWERVFGCVWSFGNFYTFSDYVWHDLAEVEQVAVKLLPGLFQVLCQRVSTCLQTLFPAIASALWAPQAEHHCELGLYRRMVEYYVTQKVRAYAREMASYCNFQRDSMSEFRTSKRQRICQRECQPVCVCKYIHIYLYYTCQRGRPNKDETKRWRISRENVRVYVREHIRIYDR